MPRTARPLAVLLSAAVIFAAAPLIAEDDAAEDETAAATPPALAFTMQSLDGKDIDLSQYAGKVVLMVNVASKCGHTKQYKDLQALHEKYAKRGLAILGFPCNQFGGQEPGTAEEIAAFCEEKYGVTFDLFAKINVNGDDAAPLYQYLTSDKTGLDDTGKVRWNFEKFLLDREGNVIARYRSKVKPTDEQVIAAIEAALGAAEADDAHH